MIRANSQCGRILRVLADGKPHTVPDIHRRAGTSRLNSRVAELRKQGATITCERVPGRTGAGAYRYQMTAMSGALVSALSERAVDILRVWTDDEPEWTGPTIDSDDLYPRDEAHRYRIYAVREDGELGVALAACDSPAAVGVALITLADEGELERACVGVLDVLGEPGRRWKINPYDPLAR